jgi:hypothetical protein
MARTQAYLEIGLHWRQDGTFDVTLEYDDPQDRQDLREPSDVPVTIDLDELAGLVADIAAYARRLAEMVLGGEKIARRYAASRAIIDREEQPLHG